MGDPLAQESGHEMANKNILLVEPGYRNKYPPLGLMKIAQCHGPNGKKDNVRFVKGEDPSAYGSMLELSWRGSKPLTRKDGSERRFILDGDTVIMRGHGVRDGVRVGFGEVRTRVLDVAATSSPRGRDNRRREARGVCQEQVCFLVF